MLVWCFKAGYESVVRLNKKRTLNESPKTISHSKGIWPKGAEKRTYSLGVMLVLLIEDVFQGSE